MLEKEVDEDDEDHSEDKGRSSSKGLGSSSSSSSGTTSSSTNTHSPLVGPMRWRFAESKKRPLRNPKKLHFKVECYALSLPAGPIRMEKVRSDKLFWDSL